MCTKKQMLGYLSKVQKLQRESNLFYFDVSLHKDEKGSTYICVVLLSLIESEVTGFALYDFYDKEKNDEVLNNIVDTINSAKK